MRPATVSKIAGVDVRGFRHSVSVQAIIHIRSRHPNLTAAELGKLPLVVKSIPTLSPEKGVNGVPRLKFTASIGGAKYIYVAEVRRRAKRIDAITFYRV